MNAATHICSQAQLPPHYASIGRGAPILILPATGAATAQVDTDSGICAVSVVLFDGTAGIGICLDPAAGRELAEAINRVADKIEGDAAVAAALILADVGFAAAPPRSEPVRPAFASRFSHRFWPPQDRRWLILAVGALLGGAINIAGMAAGGLL